MFTGKKQFNRRRLIISLSLGLFLLAAIGLLLYIKHNPVITADEVVVDNSEANSILILVNQNSADSIAVGRYYQSRRNVPSDQILYLQTTSNENISLADYNSQIKEPVKIFLTDHNLKSTIKYIVPTFGIPSRIDGGYAVDSYLVDVFDTIATSAFGNVGDTRTAANNPYYRGYWNSYSTGLHNSPIHLPLNSTIYLVSRLDGTSLKVSKGLVDKAIYASVYTGPAQNNQAYVYGQPYLSNAQSIICGIITTAGYNCKQVAKTYPVYDNPNINDYDPHKESKLELDPAFGGNNPLWLESPGNEYFDIWGNWRPGAVPIYFQSLTATAGIRSTSAWRYSVVANLLAADVTATTGTVTEPYANALPQPAAFFDYFLNGTGSENHFNFAESMYMSMYKIKWTNIVIGDPLYKLSDNPTTDTSAPDIKNVSYSCANSKANIYWSNKTALNGSPEISYGSVNYGLTNSYGTELWDETSLNYFGVSKKNYLSEHSFQIDNMDCTTLYYFKLTAVDPEGNTTESNFILNKPNDPPVLSQIGAKTVDENSELEFSLSASDVNEDDLIFSTSELPFGATFDPATKIFSWTPNYSQSVADPYSITFTVDDQKGGTDSETVLTTVNNILPPGPVIILSDPPNYLTTFDTSITISYTVDGAPKTKTFTNLRAGENQLSITEISQLDSNVSSTINFTIIYKPPLTLNLEKFSTSWNMISFPDLSTAITNADLLSEAKIRQYDGTTNSYIKGELQNIILTPGAGYWIKLTDLNIVSGKRYALNQITSTEIAVTKGWNLLGNPFQSDLPLSHLSVRYKDGSIRSYEDAINRREVSGYAWSWEASIKQYLFIAINPDKYKTTAQKQTIISSYRGFWMIVKSDQVNSIIFNN